MSGRLKQVNFLQQAYPGGNLTGRDMTPLMDLVGVDADNDEQANLPREQVQEPGESEDDGASRQQVP